MGVLMGAQGWNTFEGTYSSTRNGNNLLRMQTLVEKRWLVLCKHEEVVIFLSNLGTQQGTNEGA